MPLFDVVMRPKDGPAEFEEVEGTDAEGKDIVRVRRYERRIQLVAADEDEARFMAEQQARDLVSQWTSSTENERRARLEAMRPRARETVHTISVPTGEVKDGEPVTSELEVPDEGRLYRVHKVTAVKTPKG